MKSMLLVLAITLVAGAGTSFAAVNCNQVNRYLETGRSVEDIATTMVIPEEEIRKCQEEAEKKGGAADAEAGAGASAGAGSEE